MKILNFSIAFLTSILLSGCNSFLTPYPPIATHQNSNQDFVHYKEIPTFKAQDTIQLEHYERMARLQEIAKIYPNLEYKVFNLSRKQHGISSIDTDIPILSLTFRDTVFFDSASDVLKDEGYKIISLIADSMKLDPPDVSVFVVGHTDSQGSLSYNYDLGLRRANSTATALMQSSVKNENYVYSISFGEEYPVRNNKTEEGRSVNRRVDFLFAAHPEALLEYINLYAEKPCTFTPMADGVGCQRNTVPKAVQLKLPPKQTEKLEQIDLKEKKLKLLYVKEKEAQKKILQEQEHIQKVYEPTHKKLESVKPEISKTKAIVSVSNEQKVKEIALDNKFIKEVKNDEVTLNEQQAKEIKKRELHLEKLLTEKQQLQKAISKEEKDIIQDKKSIIVLKEKPVAVTILKEEIKTIRLKPTI